MGQLLQRCRMPQGKVHPQWSYNAVIYELNVRQFSRAGDFRGVVDQLPRLAALGVDIIWLMPIFPIGILDRKGSLGSYYSTADYMAVNAEFGGLDDFGRLVEVAHGLGMRVILDWVPNHTSRDAVWVHSHPEWYVHLSGGGIVAPFDWSDTAQLDYSNLEMRVSMIEAMKYWVREFNVDGFRVDMAMLVPMEFLNQAVESLMEVRSDIFMLAEAEGADFHAHAFDASYGWAMHHLMVDVAQRRGGHNGVSGIGGASNICMQLQRQAIEYAARDMIMNFTSNHDENTWNGPEFQRFGGAARAMAMLTFVMPGVPMIYNGQEQGVDQSLNFFERDPIAWTTSNEWTALYGELIALRHSHPALKGGELGGDLFTVDCSEPGRILALKRVSCQGASAQCVSERREDSEIAICDEDCSNGLVIAIFNLSDTEAMVEFHDPDFQGSYRQVDSDQMAELRADSPFYLGPWGAFIYYR